MKYFPVVLALISSSAFAEEYRFVEFSHATYDSDFGMKYDSNALELSIEAVKNLGFFVSYERSDGVSYLDTAKMLSKGIDNDATYAETGNTATITFLDFFKTEIRMPSDRSYTDSDATLGMRLFNDVSRDSNAYWDLKFHKQSIYNSSGVGFGTRLGMRFIPFPAVREFKLGAFGDVILTNISSVKLDTDADKISLNLNRKTVGGEAIYIANKFTFGASVEQNQLVHKFSFKLDSGGNFDERFNDAYKIGKIFVQYHF